MVELVIALALIGLITLLLFAGLRLGTRAWEGVEATAERTAELRVARNFLERALLQARAAQMTVDAEKRLVFGGDAETLELAAPLSEHVGIAGLYILRVALEEGERRQLVLTRWLLHPDAIEGTDTLPQWEPYDGPMRSFDVAGPLDEDVAPGAFGVTLLLAEVEELKLSYFGTKEGDQDPDWHEDWLEQPRLPLVVRLHLTTPEQSWPDTLIQLPDFEQ